MNIRTPLLLLSLVLLNLSAGVSFAASSIESEPLPPPPGQQGTSGAETRAPISSPTTFPVTPHSGTAAQSAVPSSTDNTDDGMSGASGGSSAYDLGKPAASPDDIAAPKNAMPSASPSDPISIIPAGQPIPHEKPKYSGNRAVDTGVAPKDDPSLQNKKFCTLKVAFSSIGTGVDSKTGDKVKSYLDANAGKLTYTRHNWGREGEYTYCLDVEHNNRAEVYKALKKLLPAKKSNAPITELSGAGFTTITTALK